MLKAGCGKAEPLTGDGSGVHCAHSSDAEIGSASSQVPAGAIPPPPKSCSLDLRRSIQWGAATAAFQIEGGWDAGGRTPSIWDTFSHQPGVIVDNATADVACDHYHKYKEDFKLMADMGIKHYRFSISWNRILPSGISGSAVNPEGLAFYDSLLDAMADNGIVPYATMFHWDLPQVLQDQYGGLMSAEFIKDFVGYASVLFRHFGWRVKNWMTFNEPWCSCALGYGKGDFAPGIPYGDEGQYKAGHNLLLAHAKVVELYNSQFRATQRGRIGIVLNATWHEPLTDSLEDKAAASVALHQDLGWFAHPVYFGDYPDVVKKTKPVPSFTPEQRALFLANQPDFFALNFYTADYVRSDGTEHGYHQGPEDKHGKPIGPKGQSSWLYSTPWAIRKMLVYVQDTYKPADVWVTENGASAPGEAGKTVAEAVKDSFRVGYYQGYMDNVCKAVADGVKLSTYFAWSAMDNFEWRMGYSERFGIVAVDFGDPQRTRAVKDSGKWLSSHFFRISK